MAHVGVHFRFLAEAREMTITPPDKVAARKANRPNSTRNTDQQCAQSMSRVMRKYALRGQPIDGQEERG